MCLLFVDTNSAEDEIFETCRSVLGEGVCLRKRLDIGDFQVEGKDFKIVIERKTWGDLTSSFADGRYNEQKERILASSDHEPCYIVEGPLQHFDKNAPHYRSSCACIKMSLRDKVHVIHSASKADTASIVCYIFKNVLENGFEKRSSLVSHSSTAFKRKRDNLDSNYSLMVEMIAVIPGVSMNKAKAIVDQFPNPKALMAASEREISEIQIGGRKMGPSISRRIVSLFSSGE
jgi:ERCC4-type nuclease